MISALGGRAGTLVALTSAMVQVVLSMRTHPNRVTQMIHTLRSLMLPLPAAPGFVSCKLYREGDDSDCIRYIEEWQTAEDLDSQIRSNHYTRLLALMEEAAEPPEFRVNWITHSRGLEYLESVRLGAPK